MFDVSYVSISKIVIGIHNKYFVMNAAKLSRSSMCRNS
jgi:hypothetical protein